MADANRVHMARLIAIPALITLAVTILRVVGELHHWPRPWVNSAAGGGGALIGIAWLPIVFGPYFALRLAAAGRGPESARQAIIFAFLGFLAWILTGKLFQHTLHHPSVMTLVALFLMLLAGFIPLIGWRSLGQALLNYGLAARIPVLVVMRFAMMGNGGAGWGTHYDAVAPQLAALPLPTRYLYAAVLPQLTAWIGWTVVLGAIFGTVVAAIVYRGKRTASAGS